MINLRRVMVCLSSTLLLVGAACTGESVGPPGGPGAQPGSAPGREELSPLIISALSPDPIPVKGTDGKYHVVYELAVLNAAPRAASIVKVETLTDDAARRVLTTMQGEELVIRTLLMASYPREPAPVTSIPAGHTAVLLLGDVYDNREAVPPTVTHRIEATFAPPAADQHPFAGVYPDQVSQIGGVVRTSDQEPLVIGPPVQGESWVAFNACCTVSPHRVAMLPTAGRINGTERYAVDWLQFDLSARPLIDLEARKLATFSGDPARNESYFAYDQPLLAVADATVVSVVSDEPEQVPRVLPTGLSLEQYGGNQVVLDLGSGAYAFYAHVKHGSISVRPGDRVTKGQEIGRLGNSGNSSEPHLHFHVMASPQPLTADNLPFQIDHFEFLGTVTPEQLVSSSPPGSRTNELPLAESAANYPVSPRR